MKRKRYLISLAILFGIIIYACSTVPLTGRRQINIIPNSQMLSMSFTQYDDFLQQHKLSTNNEQTALIKKVGGRISAAVEKYFADHNLSGELDGYKWEFNLVESDEVNAWCMPGGKVVFYTGILPITQTEAGVAVVMGHEIAHAVAEHGNERMSQEMITQLGGMALSKALETKPEETQQIAMTAFGLGAQFGVLLPFSRTHESEADHLGLIFMAIAGYDPHEAISFWKRMDAQGGQKPPEFLSTHPSNETRIADIEKEMPEAMKYYRQDQD